MLKTRLDKLEQTQLSNNIMITGIQEGPYEQYSTAKLWIHEMIAVTINSGNAAENLETVKKIEITSCNRVGKFRHNFPRPISVTFLKCNDKESFLLNKRQLPSGVFTNEEFPFHIKCNRDCLRPIFRLAKSLPQYQGKCKVISGRLIVNSTTYKVEDIPNLPPDLSVYKAAEKLNGTHIVFTGDLSPYSNLHVSPFTVNGQQFHSSEQWIQYQKALTFGDSHMDNLILQSETQMECKKLSYRIHGVDNEKWKNEGYEVCYDGIREMFAQNHLLLFLLKITSPKILAEATPDHLWGTGIALRDKCALDTDRWSSPGWLSRMLITIRDEL